ncbi:hypothetical protein F0562_006005 [Nyssa sinensis]|uniref:Uncharacterized protein n=1 Tax=Nyssa sinensis TaxID=561372 RepID=A0A5J5ANM3_9ASTE|nr:hypothetical protein F0562_006005 [Nyssa sinensis]
MKGKNDNEGVGRERRRRYTDSRGVGSYRWEDPKGRLWRRGGDDGGDDDDYFDDFDDEGEGDEGGLFKRRIVLQWRCIYFTRQRLSMLCFMPVVSTK